MKKQILPLIAFLLFTLSASAQADYSGNWKGAIELPGMSLELAIDLKKRQTSGREPRYSGTGHQGHENGRP